MFFDEAAITFIAGHGGPGKASFFPGGKSGPDGGDGGKGGDVYIYVTSDLTALNQFSGKKFMQAQDGEPGQKFQKSGKAGHDITITLPVGSTLIDKNTNQVLFELDKVGETLLICKGGKGGKGNYALRSSRNTTPRFTQRGLSGEVINLKIILKLIADYGFIGLPNAGKSSLLNELTNAHVKVASYPFTTLEPNLGVMSGKIMADIPGLIEGACEGKGLGIKFLKHIEKVKLLLHCLDSQSDNIDKDYKVVRGELGKFNQILLKKPAIILLTKSDLVKKEEIKKKQKILQKHGKVMLVSIHDWDSLEKLKKVLKRS